MELQKIKCYLLAKQYRFIQDIEYKMCQDMGLTHLPIDRILAIFCDLYVRVSEEPFNFLLNKNCEFAIKRQDIDGSNAKFAWHVWKDDFLIISFLDEYTFAAISKSKQLKTCQVIMALENGNS